MKLLEAGGTGGENVPGGWPVEARGLSILGLDQVGRRADPNPQVPPRWPRRLAEAWRYWLALAGAHGGRFVTFDQRVGVVVVPAASSANLCVIACD